MQEPSALCHLYTVHLRHEFRVPRVLSPPALLLLVPTGHALQLAEHCAHRAADQQLGLILVDVLLSPLPVACQSEVPFCGQGAVKLSRINRLRKVASLLLFPPYRTETLYL